MKKTNRNQNMTDQQLNRNMPSERGEGAKHQTRQAEHFEDKNLDQGSPHQRSRYDDTTGTVDNRNRR